jgi:hypothetical protein
VAVPVGVSDTLAVCEPDALTDAVVLGDDVAVRLREGAPERVPVREPVLVPLAVRVLVGEGVHDALGVSEAEPLGEGVLVGSDDALTLALTDDVGDGVAVGVPVVGGGVSVLDALRVRLRVALREPVVLAVRERLEVALGLARTEMLPEGELVRDAATVREAVVEALGLAETLALTLALGVTDAEGELDAVGSAVAEALAPQPGPGE